MIAKMIQNLENKMELQVNRLEARIEKMQKMFNKGLEEIKKKDKLPAKGSNMQSGLLTEQRIERITKES